MIPMPHISVCVCTFKRPELLRMLLDKLVDQTTDGAFTYSVVVSDNDHARSAESTVAAVTASTGLAITYCVEPEQNIALARNRAVANASGDFIAFIDDDEFPGRDWLLQLLQTHRRFGADGVLGPVLPYFQSVPPSWLTRGKFFDRPTHETGYRLAWAEARSGNVLFKRSVLNDLDVPFRSQFDTAGEDVDFFRRLMEAGRTFVWCAEAPVHEVVPAVRCTRSYLLRRAVLRGSNFPKHPRDRVRNAAKSLVAVPCYALALPVFALLGQHLFVIYLIKLLDHGSRLFAFLGVPLVTRRQT
jgi:glycosyltransferase involved in cell wall biosynthesis